MLCDGAGPRVLLLVFFLVSLSMVSKRRLLHTGNAILATDVAYSSAWGLLSDTIFCP